MLKNSLSKLRIYRDKTKILFWFLCLICILTPLILLAFAGMAGKVDVGRYEGLPSQIGFVAISILALGLLPIFFSLLGKLLSTAPAIVITNQGLHITNQPRRSRFLLWQQIRSIGGFGGGGGKVIAVHLHHPAPHLTYGDFWQKRQRKKNYKIHNTPIVINSHILRVDHRELVKTLKHHLDR